MPSWSYVNRALRALPLVGSFHGSDVSRPSLAIDVETNPPSPNSQILQVFGLNPLNPSTEIQTRWIAFANTLNREHSLPRLSRRRADTSPPANVKGYTYWPQYQSNSTLLQFTDLNSNLIFDTYRKAGMDYFWSIVNSLSL